MKIGVIGVGMVGGTIKFGFERLGHEVACYDPHKTEPRSDGYDVLTYPYRDMAPLLDAELIFVCVPTPSRPDGSCDVSIVEEVVEDIFDKNYVGLIVIKSTVTPGTTERLMNLRTSPIQRLAFCPEFLRERTAISDFCDHHEVCIVGTHSEGDFDLVKRAHGHYPRSFAKMEPTEAELSKYFSNVLNALRITFANQFYDVCQDLGADYSAIKNAVAQRYNVGPHYLECNPNLRAYGGNCLPKDVKAFRHFVRTATRADPSLWAMIDALNGIIADKGDHEAKVA